ncbi:DUF6663 family protein [Natrononativus amylolyticus]|uniref:DUF6663 family protein n=1 Tax=Natrononativus amylolyticus TaxID=2963434 RepID=UPI0020CC3FCF|nr:DUF6663 family protein [Natrononativus amylolyticus]
MNPTTAGVFRVYPGRQEGEWLFLDVDSADPTYVPEALASDLESGNRVEATLEWDDGAPTGLEYAVVEATRFRFRRTDEPVFQAAQGCFEEARRAGEAMNARVTYSTDSDPNGVVYTFADQAGQRDLFAEFRDGGKPLEPLLARAADSEAAEPPFSVWVLDPQEPFVLVYIVLDPEGVLEETMADTYE